MWQVWQLVWYLRAKAGTRRGRADAVAASHEHQQPARPAEALRKGRHDRPHNPFDSMNESDSPMATGAASRAAATAIA